MDMSLIRFSRPELTFTRGKDCRDRTVGVLFGVEGASFMALKQVEKNMTTKTFSDVYKLLKYLQKC